MRLNNKRLKLTFFRDALLDKMMKYFQLVFLNTQRSQIEESECLNSHHRPNLYAKDRNEATKTI